MIAVVGGMVIEKMYKSGSQHGNLKPEAAGALGMGQMPPAAFSVRGNRVYCVWKFTNN